MIQLSSKTGLPKDTLGRGLTAAALKQLDRHNKEEEEEDLEEDVRTVASRYDYFHSSLYETMSFSSGSCFIGSPQSGSNNMYSHPAMFRIRSDPDPGRNK
jgi:hypothetical protein